MHTEITFSMDVTSRAPHIVGASLVPQADQYSTRWVDRGDRAFVTLLVRSSVAEKMVTKVCAMHPSVRCIKRDEVTVA